eukprot:Em0018g488a
MLRSVAGRILNPRLNSALVRCSYCTAQTPKHTLSPWERFVVNVTRTGKTGEIPGAVSYETMDKANSRFRIMLMFGMMSFCVLGSVAAIRTGKENVRSHEGSLYTKNRDRYAGENNR